jgi:hypothetical protein
MMIGGMTRAASARKFGSNMSVTKLRDDFGSETTAAVGVGDGVVVGMVLVVLTRGMFMRLPRLR